MKMRKCNATITESKTYEGSLSIRGRLGGGIRKEIKASGFHVGDDVVIVMESDLEEMEESIRLLKEQLKSVGFFVPV